MNFDKHAVWVAAALWAGVGVFLYIIDIAAFQFQMAVWNGVDEIEVFSEANSPFYFGAIGLLFALVFWSGRAFRLAFLFALFDLGWLCLDIGIASLNYRLCLSDTCYMPFEYDFTPYWFLFSFLGYAVSALAVHTVWLIKLSESKRSEEKGPVKYVAEFLLGGWLRVISWLEVDTSAVARRWVSWASLPLWQSGKFLVRQSSTFWVALFAMSLAATLATQLATVTFQVIAVFIVERSLAEYPVFAYGAYLIVLVSMLALFAYTSGKWVASSGLGVHWATSLIAILFVQITSIQTLVYILETPSHPDYYSLIWQQLFPIAMLLLGFLVGYRSHLMRQSRAV